MRLLIDARMADWTGVGQHTVGLIRGLIELNASSERSLEIFLVCLPSSAPGVPEGNGVSKILADYPVFSLRSQPRWATFLKGLNPDLVHVPHFPVPLLYRGRVVPTIHDLIPLLHPETLARPYHKWVFGAWVRRAARRAPVVMTVSETVRRSLAERLGLDPERVVVAPNALDPALRPPSPKEAARVAGKFGLEPGYILYVGAHRPHKNLVRLVEAYKQLPGELREASPLVLAGREDRRFPEVRRRIAALSLEGGVRFPGHVSREDLPALYAGAGVLVLPSLYEGFGLPPLEAAACGAPVAVSRLPVLEEILGEAALFFEPSDAAEMAQALGRVLREGELADDLRRRGRERAALYTPRVCAESALRAYELALA